jgi:hypothetical protein
MILFRLTSIHRVQNPHHMPLTLMIIKNICGGSIMLGPWLYAIHAWSLVLCPGGRGCVHEECIGVAIAYLRYYRFSPKIYCYVHNTLAARGLEEHDVRITLIFSRIISFMSFKLCYSRICTFFEEFLIHNSHRRFMILKNNWPNLLGLCHFPLNT